MRTCSCATKHGEGSFGSHRVSWVFQGSTEGPWASLSTWESGPCSWRACPPVSMFDSADKLVFSRIPRSTYFEAIPAWCIHTTYFEAFRTRCKTREMWFEWEQAWWFLNAKPLSCIATPKVFSKSATSPGNPTQLVGLHGRRHTTRTGVQWCSYMDA